jgi:BCCT, betaine/carnitine/choline family transporter
MGLFISCLSRGRKLWEVIVYCLAAPVGYCLVWFCIWGGIGLRHSRQGLELQNLGAQYFNSSEHFLAEGSSLCYNVPQDNVLVDGVVVFTNHLPGITPVCLFDPDNSNTAVFNVLYALGYSEKMGGDGLGPFYVYAFILTCVVYFAIGSEYSSLALDCLAANGYPSKNLICRMFWLTTVAAVATALLSTGGKEALDAVNAAIIVCGLPFAIVLCYVLQSITLFCQAAEKSEDEIEYIFPEQAQFKMPVYGGIFNVMEYALSLGKVHPARVELDMHQATVFHVIEFIKGVIVPFVPMYQILSAAYPLNPKSNVATVGCYTLFYVTWIALWAVSFSRPGLTGWTVVMIFVTGATLAAIRNSFRARYNLRSNPVADLVAGVFIWPQVFVQMRLQSIDPVSGVSTQDGTSG